MSQVAAPGDSPIPPRASIPSRSVAVTVAPIQLLPPRRASPLAPGDWLEGPWGMNNANSYTPLESLLLFTWIRTHALEAFDTSAFGRASQDLINNAAINQDPAYDAARLTPGLLQELFLELLQEDLKDDHDQAPIEPGPSDGPLSPNNKKRKRPAPPVQVTTLLEARQHVNRLPNAEAKLWAKYKQKIAEELWEEQQEERRLEQEIELLERQERDAVSATKAASAGPGAVASPVKEASRPQSTASISDVQTAAPQTNGTGARPLPPPMPTPAAAPNATGLPPPQVSPVRHAAVLPSSQQTPVASPGQSGSTKPQASPKPSNAPAPVLQRPPTQSAQPPSATPPVPDNIHKPAGTSLPGIPSQASQSPHLLKPGSLKWEPPYQPPPGAQQQRSPNVAQYPQQRLPHSSQPWPQPPLQHPHPPPLQAPPQGHVPPHASFPPRSILGAQQHGGPGAPPIQPAPSRSHSASPAPLQRPSGVPSPLAGQPRLPQSPYQHGQSVVPPPQSLPPPKNRLTPTMASTPPPLSPSMVQQQPQQWPQPPGQPQMPPTGAQQAQQLGPSPAASLPHPAAYKQPYPSVPRPAVPPHVLAPPPQQATTPGMRRPHPVLPHTPLTMPFAFRGAHGSGTKWTSAQPTPSTPGPIIGEVQSPAFEPLSPVLQSTMLPTAKKQSRPAGIDTSVVKKVPRAPRSAQHGREGSRQRRTPSATSPRDDQSQVDTDFSADVKHEERTPRPLEDAGDTTADESMSGRRHFASPRHPRGVGKRKRQDSAASDPRTIVEFRPRLPPPPPPGIPTHVLWTRAFPKVSSTCLDSVVSHKYANMFQNPIKPKEAPGYKSIILRPTCLKEIQKAITAGHKAAAIAAAALPDGDPGTSSVWLPISEELVPPRAIINSTQLERELLNMFANAIMYNLDPNRGPGPAFQKGSGVGEKGANEAHGRVQSHAAGDSANMIGYKVDENSVVNETISMFQTVERRLIDLRTTEAPGDHPPAPLPPGAVPTSERLARGSFVGSLTDHGQSLGQGQMPASGVGGSFAEDETEEVQDREPEGAAGTAKRRRLGRG